MMMMIVLAIATAPSPIVDDESIAIS